MSCSTGTTWRVQQRYVNTGLDENVAVRLWLNGTPTSLGVVTDRQGSYIMGVTASGAEQTSTGFYLRNAFGKMESGSTTASSMETHIGVGFTGAGTPTAAGGGYVYLRNRWYDPQTGRFLSQDPIGLAGGVNLYAYAGNNPVAYSDPFGLDTVRTDAQTRKQLSAECARSSDFCAPYNRLEADPTIWTLQVVGSGTPLPPPSLSGNTTVNRMTIDLGALGGVGQVTVVTGGTIVIKPSDFAQNSRQEGGVRFTFGTVVAHEFGHALGGIDAAKARPTSTSGTFLACQEACAKAYENRYRAQAHLGYRP